MHFEQSWNYHTWEILWWSMEFYRIKWELTGLNSILWLWNRIPQYLAKVNGKFVSFQTILFTRVEFTDKQFWFQSLQQISFNEQNLFLNKICYLSKNKNVKSQLLTCFHSACSLPNRPILLRSSITAVNCL
jgi:hypothetical protein